MKFCLFTFLILIFYNSCHAQKSEWAVIDFQELILYDAVTDYCDFDLSRQEIIDLSIGKYNELWLTTQDYKIKCLPNNILVFSSQDLNNSLCNCPFDLYSINYFSMILDDKIAKMLPENTWIKYSDSDSYEYAIYINKNNIVDETLFDFHHLKNYEIQQEDENEISSNEITNSALFDYPLLSMELSCNKYIIEEGIPIINAEKKLYYKKNLKSKSQSEIIFDLLTDSHGILWLATGKKLIKFDGKKFNELNIPALSLEMDHQNNLWIGTAAYNSLGSVIKFDGTKFTFFNSLNSPLSENDGILDLEIDYYDNLWISLKRTGLPYKLDDIMLAVYNPTGVKFITDVFMESIYWNREPIVEKIKTLFSEKINISLYLKDTLQFNRIEVLIDDVVINTIYPDYKLIDEDHINFSYYLDKAGKFLLSAYLYDLNNTKIELVALNLNYQFNEKGFFLAQNEPDPFQDRTRIEYGIFQGYAVGIKIFDSFMRQVGENSEIYVDWIAKPFIFESEDLPNGIYSYYMNEKFSGILESRKMILFNPKKL